MGIKGAVGLCLVALWVAAPVAAEHDDAQDWQRQDQDSQGGVGVRADEALEQQQQDQGDQGDQDDQDDDAPKRAPADKAKGSKDKGAAKKDARAKDDAGKAANANKKPGGCVDVATQARFASVGYDHIVTLTSACKKVMTCKVTTNVNPEPAVIELQPGAQESVVMWRGSPARVFTPDVTCE